MKKIKTENNINKKKKSAKKRKVGAIIVGALSVVITGIVSVGTTLAFCLSSVAASLPEVIMLKQMMRWRLMAMFLGYLFTVFTLSGWLFNALPFTL